MDLLRDVYKGLYFAQKKQPIPKKIRKKTYFHQILKLVSILQDILN
jgi:poly(A) polymerase